MRRIAAFSISPPAIHPLTPREPPRLDRSTPAMLEELFSGDPRGTPGQDFKTGKMTEKPTFAAAITCMDGRTQIPVFNWVKRHFRVDYVDMITEAGPASALAEGGESEGMASIRQRLEISVAGHGSRGVAIVAHHDCAGNPVEKDRQLQQLAGAARTVSSWNLGIQCVTLWVDENQEVHPIT